MSSIENDEPRCNICGTVAEGYLALKPGSAWHCPSCGANERHRVFPAIYDTFLGEEFDLRTKRILALSPSRSERRIFDDRGIKNITSCDIRPDLNPDILADFTNMPEVESASFDSVIAVYVLTCVHDLRAAIQEIHRVLKPGGRFLFCDPILINSETREHTDIELITRWYGKEAYDKYKIGGFRRLGDLGILKVLADGFVTKTFYGRDPVTNLREIWHSAIKL